MTEVDKLKIDEIRNFDISKIREVSGEAKEKLLGIRMDIMAAGRKNSGLINSLKKSIARMETVLSEKRRKTIKQSADK